MSRNPEVPRSLVEFLLSGLSPEDKIQYIMDIFNNFRNHLELFKCHVPAIVFCIHGENDEEDETSLTHVITEHSKVGDRVSAAVNKLAEEEGAEKREKEKEVTH